MTPDLRPSAPPSNPPAPRLASRRKPRLRVVGDRRQGTRHAGIMTWLGERYVVEVWSFAEYDRLAEWERPPQGAAILIPGIGFAHVRPPHTQAEDDDVLDVQQQARERWRAERGLD